MPKYTVVRETEVPIFMKLIVCLMIDEDRKKKTRMCCAMQEINTIHGRGGVESSCSIN